MCPEVAFQLAAALGRCQVHASRNYHLAATSPPARCGQLACASMLLLATSPKPRTALPPCKLGSPSSSTLDPNWDRADRLEDLEICGGKAPPCHFAQTSQLLLPLKEYPLPGPCSPSWPAQRKPSEASCPGAPGHGLGLRTEISSVCQLPSRPLASPRVPSCPLVSLPGLLSHRLRLHGVIPVGGILSVAAEFGPQESHVPRANQLPGSVLVFLFSLHVCMSVCRAISVLAQASTTAET